MIFAFLFGLSMDYEVFMLSRMREAYDETGSTDKAIELGLARTGKLVTSAALILMFAFLVLSSSPGYEVKSLAIGLAAGIIFDATVIRALLVPALMKLFGDRQLVDAELDANRLARPSPGAGSAPRCRECMIDSCSVGAANHLAAPAVRLRHAADDLAAGVEDVRGCPSRRRGDATGDEQHSVVVSVEQRFDPVLPPQLLPAAWVGTRHFLGIPAVVGVHDPMSSARKLGETRRLARPRHPGHQHHGHRTTVAPHSVRTSKEAHASDDVVRRPPSSRLWAWVRFVPGAWMVVLTGLLWSIGDWWGECFSCPPGSPFGSGGAYLQSAKN